MAKTTIIALVSLLITAPLFANTIQDDWDKALLLYKNKSYKEALSLFSKILPHWIENENWNKASLCIKIQGNILTKKTPDFKLSENERIDSIINLANHKLPLFPKEVIDTSYQIAKFRTYLGWSYYQKNQNSNSIIAYEKALKTFKQKNKKGNSIAYTYKKVAGICTEQLNYKKAITYLRKALEVDTSKNMYSTIYSILAGIDYYTLEDYNSAFNNYSLGLAHCKSAKESALLNLNIAELYYLVNNDLDKAFSHLDKAILYYTNEKDSSYLSNAFKEQAKLHMYNKDTANAEQSYLKAVELIGGIFAGKKSRETAKLYNTVAEFYKNNGQLEKALKYFQAALIQIYPNFNSKKIKDNPAISEAYIESWAMTTPSNKAHALIEFYQKNKDIDLLKNAAHCFKLSFEVTQKIKTVYGSENAIYNLNDYKNSDVEAAIGVNHLLYELEEKPKYQKAIYQLMEQNKASVLREVIENKAGLQMYIDSTLINKEQYLRQSISELTLSIESEEDQETIKDLNIKLTFKEEEHKNLLDSLTEAYPLFGEMKKNKKLSNIESIQSKLKTNPKSSCVLEYFMGDEFIYIFKIEKHKTKSYKLPYSKDLKASLKNFLDYFNNGGIAITNNYQIYNTGAFKLYDVLFKPFVSEDVQQIFVIPDGILNYLPFDCLITDNQYDGMDRGTPFLIKKHQISYAPSISLLNRKKEELAFNSVLAMAPIFQNKERRQPTLSYSSEEIDQIKKHLSETQLFKNEKASWKTFKENSQNKHILHLATHASMDTTLNIPKLEFIDQSIFLPQLYPINLDANLIVLSACKTNIGKIETGEGNMSLARAFSYTGAKHLISSLWDANDHSTNQLFDSFYQYLSQGSTPEDALHLAKLKYLENCKDVQASPFYWAGFVCIHNQWPVSPEKFSNWVYGLVLLVLSGASFYFIRNGVL